MVGSTDSSKANLDSAMQEFLRKKVTSFIKWDLVRFFHDNPHTKDTAENVAGYIGRDVESVQGALKGLVTSGVLQEEALSGFQVYSLSDDDLTRQSVSRFMEACHDREFRVQAIHQVIQNMKHPSGQ